MNVGREGRGDGEHRGSDRRDSLDAGLGTLVEGVLVVEREGIGAKKIGGFAGRLERDRVLRVSGRDGIDGILGGSG